MRYDKKTLAEDNDFQKVIEYGLLYSRSELFKPNKDITDYSIDKFEWEITTDKKGKKVTVAGKEVEVFNPDEYTIKKVKPSLIGLKETWATGSLLRQKGSSGEFFDTNLAPRKKVDGLGCLYKVYGIGEDGLGFRYFTGPKKEDATRGKFYSGIPLKRVKELKSGKSTKEIPIVNFLNLAGDFGNCRHEGNVDIEGGKKPEKLLGFILKHLSDQDDIVLDFYLGSGTTAAVAHKMGRQFIGCEQLDYGENDSVVRLQNVIGKTQKKKGKMFCELEYDTSGISKEVNWQGGGDFVYCELMKYNEIYIDKIQSAKTSNQLIKLWKEITKNSFLNWYVNPEIPEEAIADFEALGKEENGIDKQKKLLCELLDKNQLYVHLSEIEDSRYKVSKEDKELNKQFYGSAYDG